MNVPASVGTHVREVLGKLAEVDVDSFGQVDVTWSESELYTVIQGVRPGQLLIVTGLPTAHAPRVEKLCKERPTFHWQTWNKNLLRVSLPTSEETVIEDLVAFRQIISELPEHTWSVQHIWSKIDFAEVGKAYLMGLFGACIILLAGTWAIGIPVVFIWHMQTWWSIVVGVLWATVMLALYTQIHED